MKKGTAIAGCVAAILTLMGFIFKIQHWPGAGIMLVLGIGTFSFYFIPVAMYKLIYDFSAKKSKATAIIGAISVSLIVLGILFKIQHWPGAGPAMLFGFLLLTLVINPLLFRIKFKEAKSGTEKLFHGFWYSSTSLILLGHIFKIFHFPFGNPLLFLGGIILCFGYLPLTIKFYNNEQFRTKLYTRLLMIPLVMFVLYSFGGNISKAILNTFLVVDDAITATAQQFYLRNEANYERFEKLDKQTAQLHYQKAMKVKELADDLSEHIQNLKIYLLKQTDRKFLELPDSLISLTKCESKDNIDIPTFVLIGDPENPKKGAWSATELKAKIFVYRQDLISMYEGGMKDIAEKTIGLKTDDFGQNEWGTYETWETGYFNHVPLIAVITVLSKLQSDVRYAESVTVEYLYNRVAGMPIIVSLSETQEKELFDIKVENGDTVWVSKK